MENEVVLQRLSYIKYLYFKGEEQARQAEVVAGFSILASFSIFSLCDPVEIQTQDLQNRNQTLKELKCHFSERRTMCQRLIEPCPCCAIAPDAALRRCREQYVFSNVRQAKRPTGNGGDTTKR